MKRNVAIVLLGILLLASNAYHVYWGVDQGITLSYREQVLYELSNRLLATSRLCDQFIKNKTKAEIEKAVKKSFPNETMWVKEGMLNTAWINIKMNKAEKMESFFIDETAVAWASPTHKVGGAK